VYSPDRTAATPFSALEQLQAKQIKALEAERDRYREALAKIEAMSRPLRVNPPHGRIVYNEITSAAEVAREALQEAAVEQLGGYLGAVARQVPLVGAGGACGMHGVYVGHSCPKCVTQPKGLA
jgi:hypothetical protein